jgi:type IV secretion system protein VirB6
MLFQTFWAWLSARLAAYISVHVAATAAAIEPVAATIATIYVMVWGYLQLRGQVDEPIMNAAVRLLTLVLVFGVGLRLWLYHSVVVDTFFTAPAELAARLVGASDPVTLVDTIWDRGGTVAGSLWDKGSLLSGDFGFYFAAIAVYALVGFVCVYTIFLISLSRIALAVLLALGPLFIVLTLFNATRHFFDSWLRELANYALVTVLTVLLAAMMLDLVGAYAEQTAARGSAILTVDALNLVLVSALVLLVMRQVLPIAARLAGGGPLSTLGAVTSFARGLGRVTSFAARNALTAPPPIDPAFRTPVWRQPPPQLPGA